jgi:glucosamine kinase
MILIADSGSTRAEWYLHRPGHPGVHLETPGLNPYFVGPVQVRDIIDKELAPFFYPEKVEQVYFYGAGLGLETNRDMIHQALSEAFPRADVEVGTDMLGAARSLCGKTRGIACILGTGSNACQFDGNEISFQPASLGYILGDEGGGVHLGKALLRAYLLGTMPEELKEKFNARFRKDPRNIIENIYRQPKPNAFIAGFAPFLSENISHPFAEEMVLASFEAFINTTLLTIPGSRDLPVGFTGSVAFHFRPILERVMKEANLNLSEVTVSPLDGLRNFHLL